MFDITQNKPAQVKQPEDVYEITLRVLAGFTNKQEGKMQTTFRDYIKGCMYRNDPKADFKEDMLGDNSFPEEVTASAENYERIRRYLFLRRACSEAIQAFNECWGEYYKDQSGTEFPKHLYR